MFLLVFVLFLFLQLGFALVHSGIRTPENGVKAKIISRNEYVHTTGYYRSAVLKVFFYLFVKLFHQHLAVLVILSFKQNHELISAHTVYGTVFEYIADHAAGFS